MIPRDTPRRYRPTMAELIHERVLGVKMTRGHVKFRYDGEQIDVPVKRRPTVHVGNWDRKAIYVDPRIHDRREVECIAVHEAVEREAALHDKLPLFQAHVVADQVESNFIKRTHIVNPQQYEYDIEKVQRSSLAHMGKAIGGKK